MTGAAQFVAGDWGTSHLRLFLCDADGVALETAEGPGAAASRGRFADIFESLTVRWNERHGALNAVLCGMVGSSIGWTETPYVACPAQPDEIFDACVELRDGRIRVVPGLSCRNRFNAPDYLRGEETQILGASSLVDSLREGRRLACLPGTHTKWVVLENGWVRDFFTAPTGELFAMLRDHSILVRDRPGVDEPQAFELGLAHCNEFPDAQVLHRLFECRSRQLSGEFPAPSASAYLSGLLIGADVNGALRVLADDIATHPVVLIGSPQLTKRYASALTTRGCASQTVDGVAAALAGLRQVYRHASEPVTDEH